jgi:hypothetical protein
MGDVANGRCCCLDGVRESKKQVMRKLKMIYARDCFIINQHCCSTRSLLFE